ncbi:nac transcription factor 29 [Phtheirospermum japonicum]|uniref:Nac transcription factor 29 n=1 Tax=Phtheirospermum japonicum TaxID=374723 RepID=A0A830CYI7_9LAMI|nr:nac transcription factor 29 [Phtheirospermum japonicum]GFP99221.1 nac transcription factor 29 [Phtheirospermum japonicum]
MPTDQELITEYLAKKVNNEPIPVADMCEVNLYEHSPHYLAVNYPQLGDNEQYFFTPRDRKYPNGNRPNRAVGDVGFWKATGADKAIELNGEVIGRKKVLVFYAGKPKPEIAIKTDWIMHEYRLNAPSKSPSSKDMRLQLDDWVLCRIYQKPERSNKKQKDGEEDVNEITENIGALNNNIIINNNNNNAIDQNQDDRGRVMMINGLGDHNEYQQLQPNYYNDGFNQVLPNNLMVAGPSRDMNFYDQTYNFDYEQRLYDKQYQQGMWGDYGIGNQGTNANFRQEYPYGLSGDIKKIVDDFMRDEEGFSNDGATQNGDGEQFGDKKREKNRDGEQVGDKRREK